jgi:hypothetical protein
MEPVLYLSGNPWQHKVYRHLSAYLAKKGVMEFGVSENGNSYQHLLREEDGEQNFISKRLFELTIKRFSQHKAGDLKRVLTNTASSQAYCFNLFLYLNENKELANRLFSDLLDKPVKIAHIELEFTPNHMQAAPFSENLSIKDIYTELPDESIGDQSTFGGTDADVAVFYRYEGSKKGVLLIEFKFIEAEFSVCSSYKNKTEVRGLCNSPDFYRELVEQQRKDIRDQPLCGYTRYQNWPLTAQSVMLDIDKLKQLNECPFRYGLNQLWRNMLLAERVAEVRGCDESGFWVLSPHPNDDYLWKEKGTDVEHLFRAILTEKGNRHFRKVHLEEVFGLLEEKIQSESDESWLEGLKEKYVII